MRHPLSLHAFALMLFLAASALVTWPLATNPHRMIHGGVEGISHAWSFDRTHRALLDGEGSLFTVDTAIQPFRFSAVRFAQPFADALLTAPFARLYRNPVFWSNVSFILSFCVAAYGAFLLALHLTRNARAALVSGTAFAFCSARAVHALGHSGQLASEWVPCCLYFLSRAARERRQWQFAAAALCFSLSLWNNSETAFSLALFIVFFLLFNPLLLVYSWRPWATLGRGVAVGGLLAAILIAPWIAMNAGFDRDAPQARGVEPELTARAADYVLPSPHHTLLRDHNGATTPWILEDAGAPLFVGYAALALAIGGILARRPRSPWQRFFLASALAFFVLSLGSRMEITGANGDVASIVLPYDWILRVPGLRGFHTPQRLGLMVVLSIAVLAAWGWQRIDQRLAARPRARAAALAGILAVVLFEHAHFPALTSSAALNDNPAPQGLVQRIREDPNRATVLKWPILPFDYQSLWLQMLHGKPAVSGVHSRLTSDQAQYYLNLSLRDWFDPPASLASLNDLSWNCAEGFPEARPIDRSSPLAQSKIGEDEWTPESAGRLLHFFNIGYLLIPPTPSDPALPRRIRKSLLPLRAEFAEGGGWLGVLDTPAITWPLRVEGRAIPDNWFFVGNFSPPHPDGRWIERSPARMAFRLDQPESLAIEIALTHIPLFRQEAPAASARLNGRALGSAPIDGAAPHLRFLAPREITRAGHNYLNLEFSQPVTAPNLLRDGSDLYRSLRVDWIEISPVDGVP